MTSPFYTLSAEDWAFFEEKGFLGVPCWGGYILCKPGHQPILVENTSPEVRHITESEVDLLVSALRGPDIDESFDTSDLRSKELEK